MRRRTSYRWNIFAFVKTQPAARTAAPRLIAAPAPPCCAAGHGLVHAPANACIMRARQAGGAEIIAIADLRKGLDTGGRLHLMQQALVDFQARSAASARHGFATSSALRRRETPSACTCRGSRRSRSRRLPRSRTSTATWSYPSHAHSSRRWRSPRWRAPLLRSA
jgi:hypothetical protein